MTALLSSCDAGRVTPQAFGRAQGNDIFCIIYFFWCMDATACAHLARVRPYWQGCAGLRLQTWQLIPTCATACFFFQLANSTQVDCPRLLSQPRRSKTGWAAGSTELYLALLWSLHKNKCICFHFLQQEQGF